MIIDILPIVLIVLLAYKLGREAGYKQAVKDCFGELIGDYDCIYPNPFAGEAKKEVKE